MCAKDVSSVRVAKYISPLQQTLDILRNSCNHEHMSDIVTKTYNLGFREDKKDSQVAEIAEVAALCDSDYETRGEFYTDIALIGARIRRAEKIKELTRESVGVELG